MIKILSLTTRIPFYPSHGHFERTYFLIKNLSSKCSFSILGFLPNFIVKANQENISSFVEKVLAFPSPASKDFLVKFLLDSLLFSEYPFVVRKYLDEKIVSSLLSFYDSFDLVHFDILHMCVYLHFSRFSVPLIVTEHNIEFLRLKRLARISKNPFLKLFLFREAKKLENFETNILNLVDVIIVVSDTDKEILRSKGIDKPIFVVPNGVCLNRIPFGKPNKEKNLLWFGSLTDPYNKDAVFFFLEKVWPLVQKKWPEARFIITGFQNTKILKKFRSSSIIIYDHVEDLTKIVEKARIFVAPIRAGSGTKLKILTAMAYGLPVITTDIGIEGISAIPDVHFCQANSYQDFLVAIEKLFHDYELCLFLGQNARNLIENFYSWDLLAQKQYKIYRSLL